MAVPLGVSFGLREVCCVSSTPRANLSAMALPRQMARRSRRGAIKRLRKLRKSAAGLSVRTFWRTFWRTFCALLCSLFVLVFGLRTYPQYDLLIRGREER